MAEPCVTLAPPSDLDYDGWQAWLQGVVLRAYGECAARHRKTVEAWPN